MTPNLDADGPKPEYETVELRDVDISYASGVKSCCLQPDDKMVFEGEDIWITEHETGRVQVFLGRNMECYSILVRAHRRLRKV